MFTFSILDLFCKFFPKINLNFWCCLINIPEYFSRRDLKPVAFLGKSIKTMISKHSAKLQRYRNRNTKKQKYEKLKDRKTKT